MTQIGTIELIATIDTSQYKKGASEIEAANKKIESSANSTEKTSNTAFDKIAKVGLAGVGAAAVAAGALIVKNIGNAVSRVDTLNNFPKVMANLGFGADEAKTSLDKLDKGVRGLPTSLDAIVSAMQNISPATGSLDEATNLTLALNNALLAGGKSADIQATAMEQFSQAIAKGKPDMMEWRSLATAMPGQLKQISNNLGYENWQKMAKAVSDGTLSFDKVKESIVSLNKDGLGELPSFAQQAKAATGGLSTGLAQMNTAITRGIGNFIQTIGSENINRAIGNIGKTFESFFNLLSRNVSTTASVANTIKSFAPVLITVTAATVAYRGAIIASNAVMQIQATYAALTKTQYVLLNGQLIAVRTSTIAQTIAQGALNTVMKLSPWGLLAAGTVALGTAIFAMTQQTNNATGATTRLNAARQAAKTAADNLKIAEDALKGAQLGAEGAAIAVERAQRAYNDAVAQYGPKSLEAREAAYNLKNANNDLANANQNVADKTKAAMDAEILKNTTAAEAKKQNDIIANSAQNVANSYGAWSANLAKVQQEESKKGFAPGLGPKTTEAMFGKGIPGLAVGGPVSAGRSYLVGENRDGSINKTTELFTPNTSGRIVNAKDLQDAIGKGGSQGTSATYNTSVNLSGIMARSTTDLRDIAKQLVGLIDEERAAKQQPLIMGGR